MQGRHYRTVLQNKKPTAPQKFSEVLLVLLWQTRKDCVQDSFFPAHCNTKAFPDRTEPQGQPVSLQGWDEIKGVGDQHTLLGHRPKHRGSEYPSIKCLLEVPVVATFLICTQPQHAVKQPLAEALPFPSQMMHPSLSSHHPPSPGAAPQPSLWLNPSPLSHSWHLRQFPSLK